MSPSDRFKPVQRIAKSREQKAARKLGSSQRNARDQQARLDELRSYHEEYLTRFHGAAQAGISASQLQEYRAFLSKLEAAIKAQEQVVAASQVECSDHKQQWQQKRVRTEALGKVMERFQRDEQRIRDSREQKEQDDRNQRGTPRD